MCARVAIVYNQPVPSRYGALGEEAAVLDVLEAVAAVECSLFELGHKVCQVPLVPPSESAREKLEALSVDLIFNLFEGFCGYPETEALIPEICSHLGMPYTGCPASAITLTLDKAKTKTALEAAGIVTPHYQLLSPQQLSHFRLSFPCIVKPCREDASHGLSEASVVRALSSLEKQVNLISGSYSGGALVEEFIDGREFNATVMGNREYTVLPVSEIAYLLPAGMPRLLTYAAKWEPATVYFQGTKAVCPAQIARRDQKLIAETALAAYRQLGCCGYARVDMRFDGDERLNVIEINSNPDISPSAGAARQAQAAGMTYTQFIEKIVQLALEN